MDDIFSIIFFIWMAFALFANKQKKLPPTLDQQQQENNPATFKIPRLANDPNEVVIQMPANEIVEIEQAKEIKNVKHIQKKSTPANFQPVDALNAFIYAEIFDKPKSLRRR